MQPGITLSGSLLGLPRCGRTKLHYSASCQGSRATRFHIHRRQTGFRMQPGVKLSGRLLGLPRCMRTKLQYSANAVHEILLSHELLTAEPRLARWAATEQSVYCYFVIGHKHELKSLRGNALGKPALSSTIYTYRGSTGCRIK